jgi:hypothetical protein
MTTVTESARRAAGQVETLIRRRGTGPIWGLQPSCRSLPMTVLAWDPVRFDVGVARMNAIHDRAMAGDGKVEKAFFEFLSLWLRAHICHLDMRYAKNPARKTG